MKDLYLVRHAKSNWSIPELSDFDRPLNNRGKRDAPFMGALLKDKIPKPDFILTSKAVRAYSTAKILAQELNYKAEKIKTNLDMYMAEEVELLKIIRTVSDKHDSLMMIGHNPGLTDFCNMLSSNLQVENIPTCGIVHIQFQIKSWSEIVRKIGSTLSFEYPKKYSSSETDENN